MNSLPTTKLRHVPQRTCLACRRKTAKTELLRLCRTMDGQVHIDLQQRLPGRGAYVCPAPACARLLVTKKALHYGFRSPIAARDYSAILEFVERYASAGTH